MKKTILFVFLLIGMKPLQAANEYNFYFYGDDDGVKTEKKGSEGKKGEESLALTDDEKIKKLAEEIAAKMSQQSKQNSEDGVLVTKGTEPVFVEPPKKSYFLTNPQNYWGVGVSSWNVSKEHQLMGFAQAKFLPFLVVEAALPMTTNDLAVLDDTVYVGGLAEISLSQNWSANLSGGVLFNKSIPSTKWGWDSKSNKYTTLPSKDQRDIQYAGIGLKWQLLKYVKVSASAHHVVGNSPYGPSTHNVRDVLNLSPDDFFWTLGVSLNFL